MQNLSSDNLQSYKAAEITSHQSHLCKQLSAESTLYGLIERAKSPVENATIDVFAHFSHVCVCLWCVPSFLQQWWMLQGSAIENLTREPVKKSKKKKKSIKSTIQRFTA